MKIKVLRKMTYDGYIIHIMQFGRAFQYLFADKKGNIYQQHITFPTQFFRLLKFTLGLSKTIFTQEELEAGENIILSGAMASIDALIKEEKALNKQLNETTKIVNKLKKNPDCIWRARTSETGEKIYQCIAHDVFIPMLDGVVPFHEITKDTKVLSPLQIFNN